MKRLASVSSTAGTSEAQLPNFVFFVFLKTVFFSINRDSNLSFLVILCFYPFRTSTFSTSDFNSTVKYSQVFFVTDTLHYISGKIKMTLAIISFIATIPVTIHCLAKKKLLMVTGLSAAK